MKKRIVLIATLFALLPLMGMATNKAPVTGTVNLNTASTTDLMALPGIGKSKADAIVAYRENHPFKAVEELLEVKGIGPKMLDRMKDHLTISGNATAPAQGK